MDALVLRDIPGTRVERGDVVGRTTDGTAVVVKDLRDCEVSQLRVYRHLLVPLPRAS
jgi:hypothetical protein